MNLYEKIIALYPTLTQNDSMPTGTITLQNDSDGKGDYIAKWDYAEPLPDDFTLGK